MLLALRLRRRMRSVATAVATLLGFFTVPFHLALNLVDCVFTEPLVASPYYLRADCDFHPGGPHGPPSVSMVRPRAASHPMALVVTTTS